MAIVFCFLSKAVPVAEEVNIHWYQEGAVAVAAQSSLRLQTSN